MPRRIIKKRIKGFLSLEIIFFLFVFSIFLQISYSIMNQFKYGYIYNFNKNKMLVLKKYLCVYIKDNFSLPQLVNNELLICENNKESVFSFNKNKINPLSLLPENYKFNYNKKPFKIYKGNINNNELLYIIDESYSIKIIIYGHDIDIYNKKKLEEIFDNDNNPNKEILFYNKDL
jgi:hypothetical protein